MSPSATLTTVLSRNVRKSSVHRVARASAWPPRGTIPAPCRSPETASAWLAIDVALPQPLHTDGAVPLFSSLSSWQKLTSPTFQMPSS